MTWWIDSVQPLEQVDMAYWGCWRGSMALKMLQCYGNAIDPLIPGENISAC
jgi:hypothetical protein